jgi:hypothetical protein
MTTPNNLGTAVTGQDQPIDPEEVLREALREILRVLNPHQPAVHPEGPSHRQHEGQDH